MVDIFIHGLGDADVGTDGGAEEVKDPEGGDDSKVEFAVVLLAVKRVMMGVMGDIPVDLLDSGGVVLDLFRHRNMAFL